ncbi:MAG: ADP-ribosylglycohydrolase family protein [Beijerinckiaceae bacterium]
MIRTSQSHPLSIADIHIAEGFGRIGVTFCPGKKDAGAMTGAWDRDLDLDAQAIADWGAAAVVTLIEDHEFKLLEVNRLGDAIRERHMDWLHLPIRDVSVPGPEFEAQWRTAGEGLRARLRDGFDVVVHCRGGLGRAGTIAARLLVELGFQPDDAIDKVRRRRPGAIETAAQERYIRLIRPAETMKPATTPAAIQDRACGALLGLAAGDAVGTTLEFLPRDDRASRLTDMVGGGPFNLNPGEWTDDTAMALALADSLLQEGFDPKDLMDRFVLWRDHGKYSCTGNCFDVGITVASALDRYMATGNPIAGSTDPFKAGNGSLMRLAPVAIKYWNNAEARRAIASLQCRTTHGAAEVVEACILFADILAEAIAGAPRNEVLRPRAGDYSGKISDIAAGGWRGKSRSAIRGSGYVVHSLEAALWCVGRTDNFRDAVLLAANLQEDADTTAAITGQLAGALYGAESIPAEWTSKLAGAEKICAIGQRLFNRLSA